MAFPLENMFVIYNFVVVRQVLCVVRLMYDSSVTLELDFKSYLFSFHFFFQSLHYLLYST